MFGRKLETYNIYIKPSDLDHPEESTFVKEGWSWSAFIFNLIWSLYYRLWIIGGILIILKAITIYGKQALDWNQGLITVLSLGVAAFVGFNGTDWRCSNLKARGYKWLGVVMGNNETQARQRFLDSKDEYLKD